MNRYQVADQTLGVDFIDINMLGQFQAKKIKWADGMTPMMEARAVKNEMTGCGPFLHDDPDDRPAELTGSSQTLWSGPGRESFLLLPVIPAA